MTRDWKQRKEEGKKKEKKKEKKKRRKKKKRKKKSIKQKRKMADWRISLKPRHIIAEKRSSGSTIITSCYRPW
jgi:hypothetical protein